MAFTYDVATNRGKVRFLLQDTTNTTPRPALLQDDEIDWALNVEQNVWMAAAACAEALAARFRGVKSKNVGGTSLTFDPTTWEKIAERLRKRGGTENAFPTAGGVYVADRDALWEDTDLLRPSFFSRLQEDPTEVGSQVPPNQLTEEYLP